MKMTSLLSTVCLSVLLLACGGESKTTDEPKEETETAQTEETTTSATEEEAPAAKTTIELDSADAAILAKEDNEDFLITIKTDQGEMFAILYDETPKHKANFIKLINDEFFNDLLFHRVIKDFMIQGGDPQSKNAPAGQALGSGGPGYTIPAEFRPQFFHKKGALSAARQGDQVNPEKRSSGSQFYIVQGKPASAMELDQMSAQANQMKMQGYMQAFFNDPANAQHMQAIQQAQAQQNRAAYDSIINIALPIVEEKMAADGNAKFEYSDEMKKVYSTVGGTPFLDQNYTVFGEVVKGLDVIDKIAAVETAPGDRPTKDVKMQVSVKLMKKKKITKLTGYEYQ